MEVDCDVKELFLDWYIFVLYYVGSYSMTSNLDNDSSTNKAYCLGTEQVIEMFKKCSTCQQRSDGGCSSDITSSYFSLPSKVTKHVTSRVSVGEFEAKQKKPKET